MTPESWLLILFLSSGASGTTVTHTYTSLTRCETAGTYATTKPTAHHRTIITDFMCIPADYQDLEQQRRLQ